jgi:hypothetical protein
MPRTTWNHCGRNTIAPKKPKAARNIEATEIVNVRLRKSWSRMIGSTARDSHHTNTAAMTSPSRISPPTQGSVHASSRLLLRPRRIGTSAAVNRPAPT